MTFEAKNVETLQRKQSEARAQAVQAGRPKQEPSQQEKKSR